MTPTPDDGNQVKIEYGPWNPGINSSIPQDILPFSTMFRAENVETGFDEAHELADFSGLSPFDVVAFRTERLVVHELLIRVTADLSVPDGPEYEELGINMRGMTRRIFDHYVLPRLNELNDDLSELRGTARVFIGNELRQFLYPKMKVSIEPAPKPTLFQRIFGKGKNGNVNTPDKNESEADRLADLERRIPASSDELEMASMQALLDVLRSVIGHRGRLIGDDDIFADLAVNIVSNNLGSKRLGDAISPIIAEAAKEESYRFLSSQEKPVIMNVKGASASGKSTIRPEQRKLAERLDIPWKDFALISPDYWRKYLLDYESLGNDHKYGAMLTGHELEIVDKKLDRYMAEKAGAGTMPHLLIDRFRFDSFTIEDDHDEGSKLLTRFGDTVFMFFMITPPQETVERAWKRGLTTGRYKAVEDLLDHNIEAYTGMPSLFFSWALSKKKRVHFEFLDNSVALNQRPKTVAFGWNDSMTILDIQKLLDIERYKKVDVEATSPDDVFDDAELDARKNTVFLTQCVIRMRRVEFADQKTGRIYGCMENGTWMWRDRAYVRDNITEADVLMGLNILSWNERPESDDEDPAPRFVDRDRIRTLGNWCHIR